MARQNTEGRPGAETAYALKGTDLPAEALAKAGQLAGEVAEGSEGEGGVNKKQRVIEDF